MNVIDNLGHDFRYAIRQLRTGPGFAATAIFVLALGISATVTIFGFVDAGLIKPLPYREQEQLVVVFNAYDRDARTMTSYLNFADWRRLNHAFRSMDAYALNGSFTLTSPSGAEQVPGTRVSAGFFRTLGVAPMLGRDFRDAEESPGAPHTAILSYDGWQKQFGGKPDVLGKTLMLNGDPTTIIGVMPRNFQFAPYGGAEFWGNLRRSGTCERDRNCWNLIAIGRLRSGVSLASASHEMQSIVRRLRDQYPDANRDLRGATLVPLREVIIGDIRPVLLVLLTGAGLLLSIACINVISLLIARSEKRQREIALRGALGASRSRLFHQFAMEGFVLAALGCLLALFFADSGSRFLIGLIPPEKLAGMPFLQGIGLHALPLMLACTLSLLAAIVFALVPLAGARGSGLLDGLKEGERGSAGRMWRRFGANLVVFEVAIAMMLLVGAGLLGKSLYLLLHVDLGFDPNHLARVQVTWSPGKYDKDEEDIRLARRIVERVSRLPGVQSVGLTLAPPIDSAWGTGSFHRVGAPNHGETNEILNRQVSSAYFATLRARLIRGRYFREDDNASKPRVAIVNRTLAERYFKGEEAVGKQIYYDWEPKVRMQIVGVIDDIKEGPLEGGSLAALYVPYDQVPCAWPNVLVRSSQPAARLLPAITRTFTGSILSFPYRGNRP
jgi:macrolide transport system ATP-binding/permease protein